MAIFVSYIYANDFFDHKQEFKKVSSTSLMVAVPKQAVGFHFVEAKNEEKASKVEGPFKSYFLGSAQDVITKEMLQDSVDSDPLIGLYLQNMEVMGQESGHPMVALFQTHSSNLLMHKDDVVVDPATRKIVFPKS